MSASGLKGNRDRLNSLGRRTTMPVIATNTSANTALIYLNRNSNDQAKSLAKLSSGSRIVTASDDAAGLAVASRLSADISTLEQAGRNTLQGRAVLQTADGALARVGDILQRLKSLAAQSASGSVDASSRGFINQEYQQLVTEINSIATQTEFNGANLIDSSYDATAGTFLVGVNSTDVIVADLTAVDAQSGALTDGSGTFLDTTDVSTLGVTGTSGAIQALEVVDGAIDQVSGYRATVGSLISRFEYRSEYIESAVENLSAARSSIMDVDIASEQTNLTAKQVLTEAAIASLAQANQSKASLLALLR